MVYSDAYVEHLSAGPFPGQVDPWAEDGHYFQQIHSSMIDSLSDQIQPQLLKMGYYIGREASLQIAEGREPDIFIQSAMGKPNLTERWNYDLAAEELLAEPGAILEAEWETQAIHIRHLESGQLVTVVEIISPSNKANPGQINDYKARRERLVVERSVNVVEIDATRSVKRLVSNPIASQYAYHVAIYFPGQSPRFIGIGLSEALKRIALPLHAEAVPMELQAAYDRAYQRMNIAVQLQNDNRYAESDLPFPSLLTSAQRQEALEAVNVWQAKLAELREEQG